MKYLNSLKFIHCMGGKYITLISQDICTNYKSENSLKKNPNSFRNFHCDQCVEGVLQV